jgi:regulator of replication initiation timing
MKSISIYSATIGSLMRENARLRTRVEDLQKRIDELLAERNNLKKSREAVLNALDLKGRLKAMFEKV